MSHRYLVHLPMAEARHLAGIGRGWPMGPEAAHVQALREWVRGVQAGPGPVHVSRITADLEPALGRVPAADRPVRGPFAPGGRGVALPGRVEYLGAGTVRLDDAAISSLAELSTGEDFRVVFEDVGPVLTVGADRYVACEEEPDAKP
jgi:hypothetical protein